MALSFRLPYDDDDDDDPFSNLRNAKCDKCNDYSLWRDGMMIFPIGSSAPLPNPDLPDDIKADYEEARSIVGRSPRGSSALLRLCIQNLCIHLGLPGEKLNADIAELVTRGLPIKVQQALDIVRVVGNESVHPGQMDLRDDSKTAVMLFELINLIVDKLISESKRIESLFASLPESNRKAIEQRDSDSS